MFRFFGDNGVLIQPLDTECETSSCYPRLSTAKKRSFDEIHWWRMIQHVKIEIALLHNQEAMEGRETPGEIISRILA